MTRHEACHQHAAGAATVADAVRRAARVLRAAGIDSAGRDARMLVAAAAGLSALDVLAEPGRRLPAAGTEQLAMFLERRLAREPVSRILRCRGFYGREFGISPDVLDPRPDTETLVEAALAIVAEEAWSRAPLRILDIGTGSGCLLVTLLAELTRATGLGTDISSPALAVARANARQHGVESRATWQQTRSLAEVEGRFDLILSNPPYIASGEIDLLEPEVRDFDPRVALDGGRDGLDIYREILAGLPRVLDSGWIVFEVGAGQARMVEDLVRGILLGEKLSRRRSYRDLAGRTRCVAWKARI